jgi:hypothetical protein
MRLREKGKEILPSRGMCRVKYRVQTQHIERLEPGEKVQRSGASVFFFFFFSFCLYYLLISDVE